MFIHYLIYLFLFSIVLSEKYKSIKAKEDDFYHKVIETKCSGNFKLKAGYTTEEKKVWHFCVNKNYCIKYIINKINGEKRQELYVQGISFLWF